MMGRVIKASHGLNDERRSRSRHRLVGPPDLWEMKRKFQIDFLQQAGMRPEHHLLDLGCGTLRGGIPLINYLQKGCYVGIEVRREVLEEGRKELEESGLVHKEPRLIACGSLVEVSLDIRFDIIWAFAVLIHLSDQILEDALDAVWRHLGDDGCFYASVNLGANTTGQWQGFPLVHREWEFYENAFRRHGLSVVDMGPLTEFGHHHPRVSAEKQNRQRMLKAWKI